MITSEIRQRFPSNITENGNRLSTRIATGVHLETLRSCIIKSEVSTGNVSEEASITNASLEPIVDGGSDFWGIPPYAWMVTVNPLLMLDAGPHASHLRPTASVVTDHCLNISPKHSTGPLSDLRYMFRQTKEWRQAAEPAYPKQYTYDNLV